MKRPLLIALALLATIGFVALGVWQVERRAWKLDLIARVDARIHAPAAPVPDAARWASLDPHAYEYRRVRVTGTFLHDRETLVQALTARGAGFWVLTPLRTTQGVVLVNRGFVPAERRDPATRAAAQAAGPVTVTGLLRASEPKGGFLRANDPASHSWYSRDVPAIAAARKLEGIGARCSNPPPPGGGLSATSASECRSAPMQIAPFFIDADATPNAGGYPVGGLTVVQFRNTHLVYALTWFVLAAMTLAAAILLLRSRKAP